MNKGKRTRHIKPRAPYAELGGTDEEGSEDAETESVATPAAA
ncbi:MAG TPA: hypothetical protein VJJ20_00135 [Candidatus Paceibacterota bacterium]